MVHYQTDLNKTFTWPSQSNFTFHINVTWIRVVYFPKICYFASLHNPILIATSIYHEPVPTQSLHYYSWSWQNENEVGMVCDNTVSVPNVVQTSQLLKRLCERTDRHAHAAHHSTPTFFAKEKLSKKRFRATLLSEFSKLKWRGLCHHVRGFTVKNRRN